MSIRVHNRNTVSLEALIQHIIDDGCKVRLVKRGLVHGNLGVFWCEPFPLIELAIRGLSRVQIQTVLCHEYIHFLQWKYGIMARIDKLYGSWHKLESWLKGKKKMGQQKLARLYLGVMTIEHHAEIMTMKFARMNNIEIGPISEYISSYNDYMAYIKKLFRNKQKPSYVMHSYYGIQSRAKLLRQET